MYKYMCVCIYMYIYTFLVSKARPSSISELALRILCKALNAKSEESVRILTKIIIQL